ncbi:metallophosphoesterase family protein [Arthrobacter sp. AD-310]
MQPASRRQKPLQRAAALAAALVVLASGCTNPPNPPGPPSPVPDVHIAAVGDMNPPENVDPDSPSGRNAAAITQLVEDNGIDAFLGLGDFQYDTAYCKDYVEYWERLWGGTMPKLYWVSAPNHDWEPGRNTDLDNFMNGQCPGSTAKAAANEELGFISNGQPYSRDFGNWHFAFLSSALWEHDPKRAREATDWLDKDLGDAKAAGKHLAVVYHEPYFTSNTEAHKRAADHEPWINVMWKHRVRLTLSGSQHNYERSCPVNASDRCVEDGMTAFQVSTGGTDLREFTSSPRYSEKRIDDTHGFLRLTLRGDGSFDWNFVATTGDGTDSGTRPAPK